MFRLVLMDVYRKIEKQWDIEPTIALILGIDGA
jgi:hypothetical protein